ncbi:hypothetical protein [Lactococcus allomyrinae]|nr:hypothetical protein [Lactococcus allomyrinae]
MNKLQESAESFAIFFIKNPVSMLTGFLMNFSDMVQAVSILTGLLLF